MSDTMLKFCPQCHQTDFRVFAHDGQLYLRCICCQNQPGPLRFGIFFWLPEAGGIPEAEAAPKLASCFEMELKRYRFNQQELAGGGS